MYQRLAQSLICPACLPREISLRLEVHEGQGEEVAQGELLCAGCRRVHPIRQGIAVLLPEADGEGGEDSYSRPQALSAYLWSHFADLWDDTDAGDAYGRWAALLNQAPGLALDAGCAVGRLTLELAASGAPALGIDRSLPFVRLARRLARTGALEFGLTVEGLLEEPRHISLPERLRNLDVEFLVADAQALPFPRSFFTRVASLNLIDKLPAPRRHLAELDRVATLTGSTLLLADPYSWSRACAPPE
ncbi:class I SAM-dependent methyltransferase, partial [Geoalkalibacter sp.]|uniref:class I SAM-dependent methyltransferase n=1 Tax=Geoalkalibacter sp. TaxID=3041440 RepID=UPI00272E11AE